MILWDMNSLFNGKPSCELPRTHPPQVAAVPAEFGRLIERLASHVATAFNEAKGRAGQVAMLINGY